MKKKIIWLTMLICVFTAIFMVACISEKDMKPITDLEFTKTEAEVKYSFGETLEIKAYPYPCDGKDVEIIADKEGYVSIGEIKTTLVLGSDYTKLTVDVTPLYNGTVVLTAQTKDGSVKSKNSVTVKVSGQKEKPITKESEGEYLLQYGWTENMVNAFQAIRESNDMPFVKEITKQDEQTYEFTNDKDDASSVTFDGEQVTTIMDSDNKRQIYPTEKFVFYLSDFTSTLKASLKLDSEKIVTSKLVSPSSAKFPSILYWTYAVDAKSTNCVYVKSYVDSQNAFGATIRNEFTVKFEMTNKTEYRWLAMELGNEYFYNPDVFNGIK